MGGQSLSIVHVASEMTPLVKVGGLGDVVGALSAEQSRRGHRVTVAIPAYAQAQVGPAWARQTLGTVDVPWGMGHERASFRLLTPAADNGEQGPRVLLVGHEGERRFFDRPGVYDDPGIGEGYPDNGERFLFFARAALEGVKRLGEPVDVVHAHDHQGAWVPCFVRTHEAGNPAFARTATVFTVHNLGYQGIHDPFVLGLAGFGRELFYPTSPFEYWGRVNYMKVGLVFTDMISTVSPRYAIEIQTSGEYGFGLEGVLGRRGADLRGILNGIDDAYWDPARDPLVPYPYDREHPNGKWMNHTVLAQDCGFPPQPDWPIVGMVTRLVDQKGLDLLEVAEHDLLRLEARFVVLGTGQARYQDLCRTLMARAPGRFHYREGFDERRAHLIEAGSDFFLMPSRYEPCGLNQMYSLRYGTAPVVRATGGLADTVQDFDPVTRQGNGFVFQRYEAGEMVNALRRGLTVFRQPHLWAQLRDNAMAADFSWRKSADGYDRLYAEALERVRGGDVPTLESVRGGI
jgi:starch synthase